MKLICFIVLLTLVPLNSEATDCTSLPSTGFLEIRLSNLLAAKGGEGSNPIVTAQDIPHYTCQVQGTTMGTYQELSVVMNYITDGNSNPRIRQFELDCVTGGGSNDWQERSGSLSSVLTGSVFMDYINLGTLTNCSGCNENANNDNHCVACDSSCNIGLMRCTGSSSSDCCVAFEDNKCKSDSNCTEGNFVANEENNFTCACGISSCADGYSFNASSCSCYLTNICLANNPCANNGVCTLGSSPDQYTCNCTATEYIGTNCTECEDCPDGYSLMADSCSCIETHICLVDDPCENGGKCIIHEDDTNYTCNCTTNYSGHNCTECTLVCNEGYIADSTCTCQLDDICKADNPCANNGVCTLGSSPDQYTCDCTGTNYIGTNCTVCGLQCSNGGTVDSTCTSCMCSPMYTGVLCDTEVNYCTDDIDCGQYGSCINDHEQMTYKCSCNEGWTGSSCADCTVSNCIECNGSPPVCERCDDDYITSSGECILKNPCPLMPCSNDGTCRSSGTDGTYECECTEAWTGVNCTECADGYGLTNNSRITDECVSCNVSNCRNCSSNYQTCEQCASGYTYRSAMKECNRQPNEISVVGISITAIIGLLLIIVLIIVILYLVYYYLDEKHTKERRTKLKASTLHGESHDNPMYVKPEELDANEITEI